MTGYVVDRGAHRGISTSREYAPLALSKLQQSFLSGRLDPNTPITIGSIVRSNLVHGISGFSGVKLLGPADPDLPLPPLKLQLSRFSRSAADAVIAAGGEVTAVYKNRLALRKEVWPHKVGEIRDAEPVRKTDISGFYPHLDAFQDVVADTAQSIIRILRNTGTSQKLPRRL